MKKFLALALALLTFISAFGCAKKKESGNGLNLIDDESVQFDFYYPDGWEVFEEKGDISIRKDLDPRDAVAEYASIIANAFDLSASDVDKKAKDYWAGYEETVKEAFPTYEHLDEKELTLGGTVAIKEKYKASSSGMNFIFEQVICVRNGTVYMLTLTVKESDYDNVADDFETVYNGFKFKE